MEEFPETKTIIIDRGEESEAALYDYCPPEIKLIEIVHADHLSDRDVPRAPLWNNYYEYAIDAFRASYSTSLLRQNCRDKIY